MKSYNTPLLEDVLVQLPTKTDERGSLSIVQDEFQMQRAFWIYDVPEGSQRGGHAHRTCAELLVAVHGSLDVELRHGNEVINVHLDSPAQGLLIRPMVWCRLYNFSDNFVGVCLASQPYQAEGYINDLQQFINETKQ